MKHYLLILWHDVQPELEGPFETDEARLARAKEVRMESDEHGVYRLDAAGDATVAPFSGGEIEDWALTRARSAAHPPGAGGTPGASRGTRRP